MIDPLEYLAQNAYIVIFMTVFAEQVGLPLPAGPVLVSAGALAAAGRISLVRALMVSLVASLLGDLLWYMLGRRYGKRVLAFLCRISIEPDHCVRSTQDGFARHGPWLLVLAKFVPGLSTVAPPLAGVVRIAIPRFLLLDSAGILTLSLILMGAGYWMGGPLGRLARWFAGAGSWIILLLVAPFLAYLGWKYLRRRRALSDLRLPRVSPDDLKAKLDAGEPVVIVDLRHDLDQVDNPPTLPGALRMPPEDLEARFSEIPRDREVVLFCT